MQEAILGVFMHLKGSGDAPANSGGQDSQIRHQLVLTTVLAYDWTLASQLQGCLYLPLGKNNGKCEPHLRKRVEGGSVSLSLFHVPLK